MSIKDVFRAALREEEKCGEIIEMPSKAILGILEEYIELTAKHEEPLDKEDLHRICHFIHYSALGSVKEVKY